MCNSPYDKIYESDEFFRKRNKTGSVMIIDSGCPRSLMGQSEYQLLKENFGVKSERIKSRERFKFGPSKIYNAENKVQLNLKLGNEFLEVKFFIVDGEVPILLGNDVMEPFEANIKKKLEFKTLRAEVDMIKTPGGHFVVPLNGLVSCVDQIQITSSYVNGAEADEVMMILLETLENDDLEKFHTEVGHKVFANLALNDEEKKEVTKVHKYFGHRSGRKIWELFAKADKLKGKKKAVLDIIDKCKVCSKFRKSPPRPRVGLPVANDFNQVVGMDLKVLRKSK